MRRTVIALLTVLGTVGQTMAQEMYPIGFGVNSNIKRLVGKLVTPEYINSCYVLPNRGYACVPVADSISSKIVVLSPAIKDGSYKDAVDKHCFQLNKRCGSGKQAIKFYLDSLEVDPFTGTITLKTSEIRKRSDKPDWK